MGFWGFGVLGCSLYFSDKICVGGKAFCFEIHDNDFADVTKNFDDCIIRKFEDLEGEIDAMMKDQ